MYSPNEIGHLFMKYGIIKVKKPIIKILILSIFGAFFVGLSSTFSLICKYNLVGGYSQFYSGLVFPIGIILVHCAGGELITGNILLSFAFFARRIKVLNMLLTWLIILIGNFIGSILISMLIIYSHVPHMFNINLAQIIIVNGIEKCSLNFGEAFIRGILSNFFSCIGMWVAMGAKDMRSYIFGLFIPNFVIMTLGLDHCVADMFYILAGLFCCYEYGLDTNDMSWGRLFYKSIIPVLLGNIIGGGTLVAMAYWYISINPDDSGFAKWGKINNYADNRINKIMNNNEVQNPDNSILKMNQ